MSNESSTFKMDEKPFPGLLISDHIEKIESLINWLESKNINVASSRIPTYMKFLDSFLKIQELNPAKNDEDRKIFDKLLYTLREVHELMWIQKGIERNEPNGIIDLLKIIVGGQPFAKDDKDTIARNIQFELRIASYFLQNDYTVDMSDTTDIIASKTKTKFYLECKRISSPYQVRKRVRESAKQLKLSVGKSSFLSKKVGIAVFDVTKIGFSHQGLTWGLTYGHCKSVIQEKLKEIDQKYDFTKPLENNKNVIGVWLQIHIPSLQLPLAQPTNRFSSIFIIMEPNSGFRAFASKEFQNIFEFDHAIP